MNDMLTYISAAVSFLVGGFSGGLIHYFNQKGKNRALHEDIRKLEKEKQAAILDKDVLLEKQKKEFTLEIEKKKYKYENRNKEYFKFIESLDSFHGIQMEVLHKDFLPVIESYWQSIKLGFDATATEKIIEFNHNCIAALSKLRDQEAKLFSQINTLKLSASEEVINLLSKLLVELKATNVNFQKILEEIGNPNFQINNLLSNELFSNGNTHSSQIDNLRDELLETMRQDLDEL